MILAAISELILAHLTSLSAFLVLGDSRAVCLVISLSPRGERETIGKAEAANRTKPTQQPVSPTEKPHTSRSLIEVFSTRNKGEV